MEPGFQIEGFDLFPGPWCFAQELEARIDGGILGKAVDGDLLPQPFPAIVRNQAGENHLQCDAVQRIIGLRVVHVVSFLVRLSKHGWPVSWQIICLVIPLCFFCHVENGGRSTALEFVQCCYSLPIRERLHRTDIAA